MTRLTRSEPPIDLLDADTSVGESGIVERPTAFQPVRQARSTFRCCERQQAPRRVQPRAEKLDTLMHFAELVRDTLPAQAPERRVLGLAIVRRDAILLEGVLRDLGRSRDRSRTTPRAAPPP